MRASLALLVLSGCTGAEVFAPGNGAGSDAATEVVPPDAVAPDAGASVDGGVDAMANPVDAAVSCTPGITQLLGDRGFEAVDGSWQTSGGTIIFTEAQMPILAAAGSRAARFLGRNAANERLLQGVIVPAGTTSLVLRGELCFVTEEGGGPVDTLTIRLLDPANNPLDTFASLSNLDAGAICSWAPFTMALAAPHAGQPVQLEFHATADSATVTSFYFDSLRLDANVTCP